jgi:hypothetical protein
MLAQMLGNIFGYAIVQHVEQSTFYLFLCAVYFLAPIYYLFLPKVPERKVEEIELESGQITIKNTEK